jgi:hypothetical protein
VININFVYNINFENGLEIAIIIKINARKKTSTTIRISSPKSFTNSTKKCAKYIRSLKLM